MKIVNNINFNYKQLTNAVIEKLSSAPTTNLTEGLVYYNTTSNGFFIYRGSVNGWARLDSQAMSASDILTALLNVDTNDSGLNADTLDGQQGSYYMAASTKLNGISAPDGAVSLNSQKITNLATPTSGTDAATKTYVDNAVQGLDVKASVKLATLSSDNVTYTYSSGVLTVTAGTTIDGTTITNLSADDRVLVRHFTSGDAVQNGLYKYTGLNGSSQPTFSRTDDMAESSAFNPNIFVFVEQGTTYGDTGWTLSSASGTVGSNNATWTQFSSAGVVSAGTGLTKVGNTISINTSSIPRYYTTTTTVSGNTAQTKTITHSIGSTAPVVFVRDSGGNQVLVDNQVTDENVVTLSFGTDSADTYTVTVVAADYGQF